MSKLDSSVFVHERALCESTDIGARTRIWAFAHVMAGARSGAGGNGGDHAEREGGGTLGESPGVGADRYGGSREGRAARGAGDARCWRDAAGRRRAAAGVDADTTGAAAAAAGSVTAHAV